jgi:hypothetical protein
MKMTKQNKDLNRCWSAAWVLAGALVLSAPVTSRAINSIAPAAQTLPATRFSPGVADIVKLVDAKVEPEVIKTYIKSSPTAYNPSATEIIALRDKGAGSDVLTAMLERGGEVRAQSTRGAPAAPLLYPGAVTSNYAPAQAYNYGAQPGYVSYAPSYPAYSDTYDYPAYNCGYSWPYCGSSFYCGLGCYPYGGYCGGGYCGYPYGWGGCGFYGGGYYGGGYYGRGHYGGRGYGGFYGGRGYSGGRGYYGFGARSAAFAGSRGGFRSFSMGGGAGGFARPTGGFRSGGGFGGHSGSFAGRGGGFGGHGSGRGR